MSGMWGSDPAGGPKRHQQDHPPTFRCQMKTTARRACAVTPTLDLKLGTKTWILIPCIFLEPGISPLPKQHGLGGHPNPVHCRRSRRRHAQACHRPVHIWSPNSSLFQYAFLHGEALDLVAEGADLGVQVRGLVRGEGDGDDGARDTAGAAEGDLAGDILDTLKSVSGFLCPQI